MPDFPRYQSKATLTTQTTSVGAVEDTSGQMLEQNAKMGQQVQDVAYKWQESINTIQKTTAAANFKSGLLDIENRATNDPDYNNSEQYFKEIEKLKTDSLKGFSSKRAQAEAAIDMGYDGQVTNIRIQNLYKKKMIDVGQTASMRLIDAEVANPTESSLANVRAELNKQVQAGIFDHKDAYNLEKKANDDLGVNRINNDLYKASTPEEVDAITQGITSGKYEAGGVTIEPDKKKALLDVAETTKKNVEKKVQAQQADEMARGRVDTISGVASGQIDLQSLDIAAIAEYDPQLGSTLTKAKEFMKNYNPKIPQAEQRVSMAGVLSSGELVKARAYAKSVNDVFMHNDNEKLGEFVLRELEKKGDGTTSSVKLAAFMQLAALKVKANNPQTPEDHAAADGLDAIKRGLRFLQSANSYISPQAVGDYLVKVFSRGSTTKEQVMEDARSVLESKVIDRHASVSKLPSLPNKIVDGEASVEDLHDGLNDLDGEPYSGNYGDQNQAD